MVSFLGFFSFFHVSLIDLRGLCFLSALCESESPYNCDFPGTVLPDEALLKTVAAVSPPPMFSQEEGDYLHSPMLMNTKVSHSLQSYFTLTSTPKSLIL